MLTYFVGNLKQQMFYQFWKVKHDTLIINQFIIKYILYGMATRRSLCWVPWRSTKSLFCHVTRYILIHLRPSTHMSNINLNNLFTWISHLANCWMKLTMFYKKENLNKPSQHDNSTFSVFPTFTKCHETT